ncbi:hypothetical protein HELRODRAFT_113542 [Helobdella robusta]|uniref:CEP76/DRC7 peptidase-like domain-containing protein n=1 Tax=Helobdella robusta TaxID=6412 RepID=T1EFT2_HELRO|nr:hypothetical protein HELRODRAFT_113542 [Helobdella robusta]ESN99748.1 hypothetical protein HELRODRAFT_113542 [Helobdella robusta]
MVYVNIYDQYAFIQEDSDQAPNTVIQKVERRWLGNLTIPFNTIYNNEKIDGTFKLNEPIVTLGYIKERNIDHDIQATFIDKNAYINLLVTFEPRLTPMSSIFDRWDSLEADELLSRCNSWQSALEKSFPARRFLTTVMSFKGMSVLATRYIKPLGPPSRLIGPEVNDVNLKQKLLARYVSMIPNIPDSIQFPGIYDVWSTSQEFIELLQGDEHEHAVLLNNYFLHLGLQSWIAIGFAIPEGKTAYVLVKSADDRPNGFSLWRATTGETFSTSDSFCPLKSVACLISADNVVVCCCCSHKHTKTHTYTDTQINTQTSYTHIHTHTYTHTLLQILANVQESDKPNEMKFDNLQQTSHWRPLFDAKLPYPAHLPSVQPDSLKYKDDDNKDNTEKVKILQESIESEIKKSIASWRKRYITRWNRYCVQIFRRLLMRMETLSDEPSRLDHAKELESDLSSYQVTGFPLNVPYTGIQAILDLVHSTRVHEIDLGDVEFAAAVYISPYPSDVLSVWLYIASLKKYL